MITTATALRMFALILQIPIGYIFILFAARVRQQRKRVREEEQERDIKLALDVVDALECREREKKSKGLFIH